MSNEEFLARWSRRKREARLFIRQQNLKLYRSLVAASEAAERKLTRGRRSF
jgi:hypothetical protein